MNETDDKSSPTNTSEPDMDALEEKLSVKSIPALKHMTSLIRHAVVSHLHGRPASEIDEVVDDVIFRISSDHTLLTRYGTKNLSSIIYKIARNVAIEHYRRLRRFDVNLEDYEAQLEKSVPPGIAPQTAADSAVLLKEVSEKLSPDDRELIDMYFLQGMSLSEIAEVRGITRQATSQKLRRILAHIKELLQS